MTGHPASTDVLYPFIVRHARGNLLIPFKSVVRETKSLHDAVFLQILKGVIHYGSD